MKILFALNKSYLPHAYGGTELSTHDLCLLLSQRGHKVAVASTFQGKSIFSRDFTWRLIRKITKLPISTDNLMGYPVFRTWNLPEHLPNIVEAFHPDVAIVQGIVAPMTVAHELTKLRIPTAMYLRVINFHEGDKPFQQLPGMAYIANSRFTASRFFDQLGLAARVIPPIIMPGRYRTHTTRTHVLFVNPNPSKGLSIAIGIARLLPDIPFMFVESWPIPRKIRAAMIRNLADTKNVSWHSPVKDMRKIYSKARLVIVPSQWEETWGRIVTEAGYSGIPCVARAVGGLPESVGLGGILISPDADAHEWARVVNRLYDDSECYRQLRLASLEWHRQTENSIADLTKELEQTLLSLIRHAPWQLDVASGVTSHDN